MQQNQLQWWVHLSASDFHPKKIEINHECAAFNGIWHDIRSIQYKVLISLLYHSNPPQIHRLLNFLKFFSKELTGKQLVLMKQSRRCKSINSGERLIGGPFQPFHILIKILGQLIFMCRKSPVKNRVGNMRVDFAAVVAALKFFVNDRCSALDVFC